MFIESLTPDQLVDFAQLLLLVAFLGAFFGGMAMSVVTGIFDLVAMVFEKLRGPDRVRDLDTRRRLHLTAAMAARRELRKLNRA